VKGMMVPYSYYPGEGTRTSPTLIEDLPPSSVDDEP